ncbi:AP2/ERF domain-containing protein [Pycnococcus provasolii]
MAPSSARIISWDTNTKSLRLRTPPHESRKRTAGDDRVSDGTHQPPPQKKAAVVKQSAQPSSHAIIAAPTTAPSSGYQGVYWNENDRVFRAQIRHNNKHLHVGRSADAKEAAFMRDRAWRDLGKNPSKLNFDDTVTIPDEYLASVANASKKVASHVVQQTAQQPSFVAIAAPSAEEAHETAAPSSSGDPVPDGPAHGSAVGSSKLSRLIKMLVLHSGLPPDKLSACLVAATDATKVEEISEDVGRLIDVFERERLAETKAALAKATASFFLL